MQPHLLTKFLRQTLLDFGQIWLDLGEIWTKLRRNLDQSD